MSNPLATFLGWAFVPSLATNFVQKVYYGVMIRAGDPKPRPGSPLWNKHNQRIKISLIIAYLLYTFYEACYTVAQEGDFYQTLGVVLDANDRVIKSKFRKLAAIHHPDKLGTSGAGVGASDDTRFVHMKLAQDTLINPVRRFAYDRFGPSILKWQRCTTHRDFLAQGFWTSAPQYIGSGLVLTVLGATGYLQWGRFWRYFLVLCLIILEIYVTTRPHFPPFLTNIINPVLTKISPFPPLLPFQLLVLARNMVFTFFIALSQLGPLLQSKVPAAPTNEIEPAKLARLEQLARTSEVESTRLLELDVAPYKGDMGAVQELRDRVRQSLVQSTLRADHQVRDAINEVLRARQTDPMPTSGRNN